MSVTIMALVWPLLIPATDKMVLLALADAANDSGVTWIAVRTRKPGDKLDILRKCSLSERAVQGAIKRLRDDGHLTRDEVPGKGCTYTVHPRTTCAPAADAPPQEKTQTPAAGAGKPSVTIIPKKTTSSRGKRATSFPSDFSPLMTGKTLSAVELWPPDRLPDELEAFADHHTSKGTLSFDWQANWRTWVRFSKRWDNRDGGRQRREHTTDPLLSAYRDACAAERAELGEEADFGTGLTLPPSFSGSA